MSEFFDRWLRDWAAINVGGKTRERYEELTNAHVKPHIGTVLIQKLQPVHLAELRITAYARQPIGCLGMDVLSISRRLGHGSPTITLGIYGHLFGSTDDKRADEIERAFGKVVANENTAENSAGTN